MFLYLFQKAIVPYVSQTFSDIVSAIFNVLIQPVADNDRDSKDDQQMLRRSYFGFLQTIVNNNIPEVISNQGMEIYVERSILKWYVWIKY